MSERAIWTDNGEFVFAVPSLGKPETVMLNGLVHAIHAAGSAVDKGTIATCIRLSRGQARALVLQLADACGDAVAITPDDAHTIFNYGSRALRHDGTAKIIPIRPALRTGDDIASATTTEEQDNGE